MNQREADRALKRWQKRLGLQDWDITVEIVRYYRVTDYSLGHIESNHQHRLARVYLKHPRDVFPGNEGSADLEETLVHELLHLWFQHVQEFDNEVAEEQAINAIAGALYNG